MVFIPQPFSEYKGSALRISYHMTEDIPRNIQFGITYILTNDLSHFGTSRSRILEYNVAMQHLIASR
jgi:hypothetical protein